ncbi:MAG: Fe-S cluster assembly protein SufD [Verrucomicrobiota bacterium]
MSTGIAPTETSVQNSCLSQLRAEGRKSFESLPMPVRTDEPWRFASIKLLDLSPYSAPQPVAEYEQARFVESSTGLVKTAGKMVFANDELVSREILSETLAQKGVIWKPLEQAAAEHPELFQKHFMAHGAPLGSKKFTALHQASVKSGTFLYVPRGVEIDLPIEVFHWLQGENASTFPHTLLIAEENSKVTLVDYFIGADPEVAGLAIGVNDLYVGAGAQLNYVCVQNWSRKTLAFQINNTVVGRNASAKSLNLNLGGKYARTESASRLTGEGGRSDMLAVTVAEGDQEFDQRTFQDHLAPGAISDLLYKNSLDDQARTIFAGMIKVEPHAHRTDAYQKVRNLLLSDEAEANSMPGLEILADDVRCSHGATSGQIEEEELFYMLARGISKRVAQRLIVQGFLQEAINRLGNEAIAAKLGEFVQAKFNSTKG